MSHHGMTGVSQSWHSVAFADGGDLAHQSLFQHDCQSKTSILLTASFEHDACGGVRPDLAADKVPKQARRTPLRDESVTAACTMLQNARDMSVKKCVSPTCYQRSWGFSGVES